MTVTGTGTSALTESLWHKIVRYMCTHNSSTPRFQTILQARSTTQRVFDVLDYYVCQHCARNNVFIKGYPVFAQYKAMSALYTKAHFSPTAKPDEAAPIIVIGGYNMVLAQAHFLWWMVLHDIDAHVLPLFDDIEEEMGGFKREMARKYRRRQRAKKRRRRSDDGCDDDDAAELSLGKTATQHAKHVQPVLQKSTEPARQ